MNIYLLHGDDQHRLAQKRDSIIRFHKSKNYEVNYYSAEDDLESLIFGMSFLATNKLIILQIDKLIQQDKDFLTERLEITEELPENINLLFINNSKLKAREIFSKYLIKLSNNTEEFTLFKPWDTKKIEAWLTELANSKNIKINRAAISKLVELYSNKIDSLETELEKLVNYTNNKEITIQDIEANCLTQYNLFSIIDAIIVRNPKLINNSIESLINQPSILPTLAGIQTIIRNYLCIASLLEANKASQDIASTLKQHPFKTSQDIKKIQLWSASSLYKLLQSLNKLEFELKTGRIFDGNLYLKYTLLKQTI